MPYVAMRAGEVWERNEPLDPDDGWNRVRVVGQFGAEVTVTPADSFGEVMPATPQSLALNYECVEQAPQELEGADAEATALANGGSWPNTE